MRKEECEERAEKRLQLWADVLVSKWFAAFSQVIADKRFAALGLVLCAALGTLCKVTGVLERIEDGADEDIRSALANFANGEDGKGLRGFVEHVNRTEDAEEGNDDVGVVIERRDVRRNVKPIDGPREDAQNRPYGQISPTSEEEEGEPVPQKFQKTNKRARAKKGDAIDDIFAGLF
jgi:ribonuclease MRP protein subunit RMP1